MSTQNRQTTAQRQSISLETKVAILDKLKSGQGSTFVAKEYGLNESTVRSIKRAEDSIRQSVSSGTNVSAKFSTYKRNTIMEEMEKVLIFWIEDNNKKRIPVDTSSIKHKALQIFQHLKDNKQQTPAAIEFSASKGWFENFKRRHDLHHLHLKGEHAFGNEESTAKEYPAKLGRIIAENSYSADEAGLFWIKMPKRTYLSKTIKSASGFKRVKNEKLDIDELFGEEEISDADLVDMASQVHDEPNKIGSDVSDVVVEAFTVNTISDGLRLGRELQMYFLNKDPDTERAMKFQRKIKEALVQYKEVYKDLHQSKQLLITDFQLHQTKK